MPAPLEYARSEPQTKSSLAVWAMACGLASGPLGYGLVYLTQGLTALLLTLMGSLYLGFFARLTLADAAAPRYRVFANIGMAASIAWGLFFFLWLLSHLSLA